MRTSLSFSALLVLGALITGCPNRPNASLPAPAPATITSFVASPSTVQAGGTIQLEWGTSNALDVTIEHVGKGPLDLGATKQAGKLSLTIDADAVFLMTAQGAGGSDVKAATVTLERKALSLLFTAVPATVEGGQPVTLVWNAAGAKSVKLEEVGGAAIAIGSQLESGSVQVVPTKSTTYRLTADDKTATADVKLAPTIVAFSSSGGVPGASEPLTLTWQTLAATSVTLRRVGLATPFTLPAGSVASGSYVDTVPSTLPADAVLQYVLEASDGSATVSRQIELPVGGGVRINAFVAPSYALAGSTFEVSWSTSGADTAELIVDGHRAYLAQSRTEVNGGRYSLSAPTQSTRVELIVRNDRGVEAREQRTIAGVGPLAYNFFRADKSSIATAGEPVRLEWSVTNARSVRITSNTGAGFYREFTGNVDTGSVVVLPNARPPTLTRVTYTLSADNGTGGAPISRTVDVDVGTSASFTFSRQLPVRAPTTVTGSTAAGTTQVAGFKSVEKNPSGEGFVDIRRTGTAVAFSSTSTASNFLLPSTFEVTLFGSRLAATRLNVSQHGWFMPTTSSTVATGRPDNDPTIGTTLEPQAIAPYWNNLVTANGQVHWQLDSVADARRLIVQWTGVRPTNGPIDARLTFQAQLYSNGRVVFAYRDFFKVQGRGTAGIVNKSETDEIVPAMPVAAGDVYRFFAPQAVPAPLRIEATPFAGAAIVNGQWMEAEGQANYPLNAFEISEVSAQPPSAVSNGQWFEIKSNSDGGVDLGGWDVDFGGTTSFQFPTGTNLPAFGRLLVGQAADVGDPGPVGGIVIEDGGVVPRPGVDVTLPASLTMPTSNGFVRLGIGGTEYTRLSYAATTVGASFGPEDLRAPWLTYSTSTRIVCDSVRYAYGANGQLGSPGLPNGSCWPYTPWETITGAFTPLAGVMGATQVNFGSTTPDTLTLSITFPQPVRLFGLSGGATSAVVSADGYIVFGGSTRCCDNTLAPSTSNSLFVAPWWDDLQGRAGGSVWWQQIGTPPNVETIISWENWGIYPQSTYTGTFINFQARFKPNGDIEFHYGPATAAGTPADAMALSMGSSASVWIEAVTAADIYVARNDDATVPTVRPLVNGLGLRYHALRP